MKLDINISTSFIGTTDTMTPTLVTGEAGAKSADFSALLHESAQAQIPVSEKNNTAGNASAAPDLMIDIPSAAKLIQSLKTDNEQVIITEAPTLVSNTENKLHTTEFIQQGTIPQTESENNPVHHFPFQSPVVPDNSVKNDKTLSAGLIGKEQKILNGAENKKDENIIAEQNDDYTIPYKEEKTMYSASDKNTYTGNTRSEITRKIEEIQNTLRTSTKSKVQVRLLNDNPDDMQVRVDISATSEKEIPAIIDAIIGTIWVPMQKQEISILHSAELGSVKNDSGLQTETADGENTSFRTVLENNVKAIAPEQKATPQNAEKEEKAENVLTNSVQIPIKKEASQKNTIIPTHTNKEKSGKNNYIEIVVGNKQTVNTPPVAKEVESVPSQEITSLNNTVAPEKQIKNSVQNKPVSEKRGNLNTQKIIEVFVDHIFPTEEKSAAAKTPVQKVFNVLQSTAPIRENEENHLQSNSAKQSTTKAETPNVRSVENNTESVLEYTIPEGEKVSISEKSPITNTQTKLTVQDTPKAEKKIRSENHIPPVHENSIPKAEVKAAVARELPKEAEIFTQSAEVYSEYIPDESMEIVHTETEKGVAVKDMVEKPVIDKKNVLVTENERNNGKTPVKELTTLKNETKAIANDDAVSTKESVNIKPKLQEIPKNSKKEFVDFVPAYTSEHSEVVIVDVKELNDSLLHNVEKIKTAPNNENISKKYHTTEEPESAPKHAITKNGTEQKVSVQKQEGRADNKVMKSHDVGKADDVEIDTSLNGEYIPKKEVVRNENNIERKSVVISYSSKSAKIENKDGKDVVKPEIAPKNNTLTNNRHAEVSDGISEISAVKPIAIHEITTEEYSEIHTGPLTKVSGEYSVQSNEEIPTKSIRKEINGKEPKIETKNDDTLHETPSATNTKGKAENSSTVKDEKNKEVSKRTETITEHKTAYNVASDEVHISDDLIVEHKPITRNEPNGLPKTKNTLKTKGEEKNILQPLNTKEAHQVEPPSAQEQTILAEAEPQEIDVEKVEKNNIATVTAKQNTTKPNLNATVREYVATAHNIIEPKSENVIEKTDIPKNKEQVSSQKNTVSEKRTVVENKKVNTENVATTPYQQENTDETIIHSLAEPLSNEKNNSIVNDSDKEILPETKGITVHDVLELEGVDSEDKLIGAKGTISKEIPTWKINSINEIKTSLDNKEEIVVKGNNTIEKQERKSEPVSGVQSNTIKDEVVLEPLPQTEKEVVENISAKENNSVKTERKPIVQEHTTIPRDSKKVDNVVTTDTENNTGIIEPESSIVTNENYEPESVQKVILPQKTESLKKSFVSEQNSEIHIPDAEADMYIPTEKNKEVQGKIVSEDGEPSVKETPIVQKQVIDKPVIENADKKTVGKQTVYSPKVETPIITPPKNNKENVVDIDGKIPVIANRKENPNTINENIVSEPVENTGFDDDIYIPKQQQTAEKTESKQTMPLAHAVNFADKNGIKETREFLPTLEENEPTITENVKSELPKKSAPKNDSKPQNKSQVFVSDSEPLREQHILENEVAALYNKDTKNTENEETKVHTNKNKENVSADVEEKQINVNNTPQMQIPLITDNGNVYVFKNEEKSNSAIIITNNESDTTINTENLPSTVSALHTIIEKASKAGVPVKNIVFKLRKNDSLTQNAEIKQSAKDTLVSAAKNKEINSGKKADISVGSSELNLNSIQVSEPKLEKMTSPLQNETAALSKSTLLSQKGIEITKSIEKEHENSTIVNDEPYQTAATVKTESNSGNDESGTNDTLLKQDIPKQVKSVINKKNAEQSTFTTTNNNGTVVNDRSEIRNNNNESEKISAHQSDKRNIVQEEKNERKSVDNNSVKAEKKESTVEHSYRTEEIQPNSENVQESVNKTQTVSLSHQEIQTHPAVNENRETIVRNIEQNNPVRTNQSNVQKTSYNSMDIRTVPADEFATVTHEYMRARTNENGMVRMVLQPEELGTVTVQYAVRNNEAHLGVQVENQNAKNIIESQLGSLREQFVKQGVHLEKIEVSIKKESEHSTNNNSQTFSNNDRGGTTSQQEQESRQAFVRSFKYAAEARKAQTTNYTNSAFNRLFNTNR